MPLLALEMESNVTTTVSSPSTSVSLVTVTSMVALFDPAGIVTLLPIAA